MKIAFVGMGKLGFPCAIAAASKNHDVVGYDVSPAAKEILASRKYPHRELWAQKMLETTTLRIVDTVDEAVAHADIVFVAVQTPHQPEFEGITRMPDHRADFDYTALRAAVKAVAESAAKQEKHTTIVVISTCLPGTCDREVHPLLNDYVGFIYNPFFIAMGTTINDYLNPEFVLLGVNSDRARNLMSLETVRQFYHKLHSMPHAVMSVASAELTKVAYNVYLGLKIVAANSVMEIAHKVGANCDDVTLALAKATDRIVSARYMRGGMGDGGGCFVPGEKIYAERWHEDQWVRELVAIDGLQKGDRVLGGDGNYHEILETYRRPYKGPVLTIETYTDNEGVLLPIPSFTVTPEHPIFTATATEPGSIDKFQTHGPSGMFSPPQKVTETLAREIKPGLHMIVLPSPRTADDHVHGVRVEVLRTVKHVKVSQYEGTVYNLNVEEVHNYVSVGGLVANCHPRDQIALSWLAQKLNLSYDLFGAMVKARESQTQWLAELAMELSNDGKMPIVVLGKAYKKGTNLTIGSPAILLKSILDEYPHLEVHQWDPHVDGVGSIVAQGAASVFVVAADHDEFFEAMSFPPGSIILDPWGKMGAHDDVQLVSVGRVKRM